MLHRLIHISLSPDKLLDKNWSDAPEQLMATAYERFVSWVLPRELEDIGIESTPQYDLYED